MLANIAIGFAILLTALILAFFFPVFWRHGAHKHNQNNRSAYSNTTTTTTATTKNVHVDMEAQQPIKKSKQIILRGRPCTVVLTRQSIAWQADLNSLPITMKNADPKQLFYLSGAIAVADIIGADTNPHDHTEVVIHAFPRNARTDKRYHQELRFSCCGGSQEEAKTWVNEILRLIINVSSETEKTTSSNSTTTTTTTLTSDSTRTTAATAAAATATTIEMHRRKILVLVNPVAGQKKGRLIWQKAKAMLDLASGVEVTAIETQYAQHATRIVRDFDFTGYSGVVVVSGDGLLFEVLNAILSRPDRLELLDSIALGQIAAGSGNGLGASCGLLGDVLDQTMKVIRGRVKPLDIMSVEQNGNRIYSFLQVSYGFVSDTDFESEKVRWMGEARYDMYATWRWLFLRKYPAKLTLLLSDEDNDPCRMVPCANNNNNNAHNNEESSSATCSTINTPNACRFCCCSCTDVSGDLVHSEMNDPRRLRAKEAFARMLLAAASSSSSSEHQYQEQQQQQQQSLPNTVTDENGRTYKKVVIEDNFAWITASNLTHIGGAVHSGPFAHKSDGLVDMTVIRSDNVRKKAFCKLLLSLDSGGIGSNFKNMVDYYRVKEFVVEAVGDYRKGEARFDVDGEPFPTNARIHVRVHQGLCAIIC